MELDASRLYNVAIEECFALKRQVIELKALYLETKAELDRLTKETSE